MMDIFLFAAILLGILVVSINALALHNQLRHPNPAPWIQPSDLAKLTAVLSVLFALFLALSALA